MSKYYYLIAGLPNISLEDTKLPFTTFEFRKVLNRELTNADKKLIDLYFLKFDNKNLISHARNPEYEADPRGIFTYQEFNDLFRVLEEDEEIPPVYKKIPSYFAKFFVVYHSPAEKEEMEEEDEGKKEEKYLSWEDLLSAFYYDYALECTNPFFHAWFELNLNICNIFTAVTCRKYGLKRTDYIIGETKMAHNLRTSNAKDFGIGDMDDYLQEVLRISDESDLQMREKRTDQLRWQWLEDYTFFIPFDIESVFTYLLKLEMMERWVKLDKATGEKTFRELVGVMKKGSENALEEFKRNNKK